MPFDTESIHGDVSFREIPKTVRQQDIGIAHLHYDHSLTEQDMNIVFPIQRFVELEKDGIIGKLTDTHHYGCAGSLADHDRTGNNSRAALQMEAAESGVSWQRIESSKAGSPAKYRSLSKGFYVRIDRYRIKKLEVTICDLKKGAD